MPVYDYVLNMLARAVLQLSKIAPEKIPFVIGMK